jgi:hypothetical protein
MTQTTEGTGNGAVERVLPKIFNGVVKSNNIKTSNVEQSDLKDGSVTTAKIAAGAITLDKLDSAIQANAIAGDLKTDGDIVSLGNVKAQIVFSSDPDTTTLNISSNHVSFNPLSLMVAYKKITTSSLSSGVQNYAADKNTWYLVDSINNDGELIEVFVSDRSFHTSYRITMQVRQSNVGSAHLVIEQLI